MTRYARTRCSFGVLLALTSAGLALNASLGHPPLWPLYVITAVAAGLSGVERPARSAALPSLVPPEHLPAAYALWQILLQVGNVAGPGLAGLLLAGTGLGAVYWIDAGTLVASFVSVLVMAPMQSGKREEEGLTFNTLTSPGPAGKATEIKPDKPS